MWRAVTRPFFIDTDTGSDDAVALVIALTHPGIDVVGIGVVAGNVPLEFGVQNALYTRELCERDDVPIYAGEATPLRAAAHHGPERARHRRDGRHRPAAAGRMPDEAMRSTPCCGHRTTTPAT